MTTLMGFFFFWVLTLSDDHFTTVLSRKSLFEPHIKKKIYISPPSSVPEPNCPHTCKWWSQTYPSRRGKKQRAVANVRSSHASSFKNVKRWSRTMKASAWGAPLKVFAVRLKADAPPLIQWHFLRVPLLVCSSPNGLRWPPEDWPGDPGPTKKKLIFWR